MFNRIVQDFWPEFIVFLSKYNIFRLKLKLSSMLYSIILRKFLGKCGKNVNIISPLKMDGLSNIYIEDNITIGYKSWIASVSKNSNNSKLTIQSGTVIGSFNEIYAVERIEIGENVLTADNVYISDNSHEYHDIKVPIVNQPVLVKNPVTIGRGAWIGRNSVIIGASIGRNSVVAANSVVLDDVPDYTIVAGVPAKVIKKYSVELCKWVRV